MATNQGRFNLVIEGLPQFREAFKRLEPVVRDSLADAALITAMEIARVAKANLRPGHGFRTGQLQKALGHSVNRRTGEALVGVRRGFNLAIAGSGGSALVSRGARLHVPTKIAHLVEFGHGGRRRARPHPFLKPAVETQRQAYLNRCRQAGVVIEQRMRQPAGGGSRFL